MKNSAEIFVKKCKTSVEKKLKSAEKNQKCGNSAEIFGLVFYSKECFYSKK